MKKKVRIYKAPNGQGAVINKTAQFLKKAQEGGMPDANAMGYPGQQAQQAQVSEDQVVQSIIADISNGRPKEETVMRLVNVLDQEPMMADQYYEQIYAALQQKQEDAESAAEEEDTEEVAAQEQETNQDQDNDDDYYNNNANTQMANDIAAEDEDVDYGDDDQVASDIIMQFGGVSPVIVSMRQDGGEAYPIQFPGVDAYLPPNMNDILNGQTDVLTGQAWSPVNESQAGVEPDEEADNSYKKGGQYKKDKRVYVNSMMKLAKKQMGGEDMSKNGDTDPRGEDVRKQRLNAFLGTVKNQSNLAKVKEQAEQQFDQMMQQQQQMQNYPIAQDGIETGSNIGWGPDANGRPRKDVIRSNNESGMDIDPGFTINPATGKQWTRAEWESAKQKGIDAQAEQQRMNDWVRNQMNGRGFNPNIYGTPMMSPGRAIFGRPRMPRGVGFGYGYPISKIDVRRTGIFGRPKQYSIEFGASPMPGMPGSGAGFYGYGQTTTKQGKTKGRIITEEIAKTVNNEAIKDVAKDTPNSTATNKPSLEEMRKAAAAAGYDPWNTSSANTDPNSTASNLKENIATSKDDRTIDVNTPKDDAVLNNSNDKRDETEIIDIKGASIIPDINKVTSNAAKKDSWGRPEGSKWYGFDPKKKVYTQGPKSKYVEPGSSKYWKMTPDQRNANTMLNIRESLGYEEGGIINNTMPDQFGNLQQFVYGGDEYFTQGDIDDVYSKDTSDPYFQGGGSYDDYRKRVGDKLNMSLRDDLSAQELFEMGQKAGIGFGSEDDKNTTTTTKKKTTTQTQYPGYNDVAYNGYNAFGNLFPANAVTNMGTWGKIKRGPYDPRTGMAIPGMGFGPNTQIKSINVTKSGMFGRPKKYTINYGNQEMDPRKQNLISLPGQETPGATKDTKKESSNIYSNTEGLSGKTKRAIRKGERRTAKEVRRGEEEFPETNTGIDTNPDQSVKDIQDKFIHSQRQKGLMVDPETQKWVKAPDLKMDIKRPGKLDYSPELLQQRVMQMQKEASAKDNNRPAGNAAYQERNRRISPSKEELQKLYDREVFAYGGGLERFVGGMSHFQPGGYVNQTPVVFTDNPAHVGMSNVDMISLNEGIPDLKPSNFWADQQSFNEDVPVNTAKQPDEIKVDPTQVSSDQAKKAYQATPGDFSIDVKNKTMYEIDPEASLSVINAGARGVTGMMDRLRNQKREAKMYDNLTADNLYASDPSRDRGDYDINTGLYRPDQQGAVHTSRSKQYGGDSNYAEGEVVDMTEDELAEFLANGGQVEYLNY